MKNSIKVIVKAMALVVVLTMINLLLLVLAFCIPTTKMRQHVADSYPLIEAENPYLQWDQGYTSSMLDGWSEYTLYGAAINEDASGNAFERAMFMWHIDTEGLERDESVERYARFPDEFFEQSFYPRYWNGIVIFMKILLLFFTIPDIRMMNMFLQLALLIVVIVLMIKNDMQGKVIPFMTALFFINPITMIYSVIFSAEYIPMLLSIIAILVCGDYIEKKEGGWNLFFALIGSVVSFLCFLSAPIIALGFPLVFLIWRKHEKNVIKTVISCSLYWVGAYGLTWAIKWIICTLFTDYNLIGNALNQMKFYESEGVSGATVVERVMRNLYPFKTTAFIMLFVVAVIILFVKHSLEIKNKTVIVEKTDWIDVIVGYILVMLIPLVMIVALGNGYAYTHAFMAHRQFSISVLGALCIEMVLIKALRRKCKNL